MYLYLNYLYVIFYFSAKALQVQLHELLCVFSLQVDSVTKKEKAKQRPLALNTVEMLRVASSALGGLLPL